MPLFASAASVSHADVSPEQFVKVVGGKVSDRYKLQDFNRARLLLIDKHKGAACAFKIGDAPGFNRSPEEYKHHAQLTEKIDIYSLGNLFYYLLEREGVFTSKSQGESNRLVATGHRPKFRRYNADDPYERVLYEAVARCHDQDPSKRSSARSLARFLKKKLNELEPKVLKSWGEPLE